MPQKIGKNEARLAVAVHLAAVWSVGCALTAFQFFTVIVALFSDNGKVIAAFSVVAVFLGVAVFAGLGTAVRRFVPLVRRKRGLWMWAAGVYAFGTAAAIVTLVASKRSGGLEFGPLFFPFAGAWYALAAAAFLPSARAHLAALATAAVLAAGWSYAVWDASRPPTLDEWITATGVDRAVLRLGDPPPGHALLSVGASEDGFRARYEGPGSAGLHLEVERAGQGTRRTDARGCPVPLGETIHCTDDGGGRLLVAYESGY
ncbi:MAG TPA: hypothetical protein VFY14_16945, partial [Streptomyces sp.]|nr:hypothetical protein [Streptomyces sp.]